MQNQTTEQHTNGRHPPAGIRPGLHLHFDPVTGIAGDMAVAALVDLGVPERVVLDAVRAMKVPGLTVRFRREESVQGLRFEVSMMEKGHGHSQQHGHRRTSAIPHGVRHDHRPYAEIVRMLRSSDMSADSRVLAEKMFARLASVEAKIHGQAEEDVTFHEVGAYDSIADIVGVAVAVTWLAPASISASPPLVGTGTVECAHGVLPVPAPATASLLAGRPVLEGGDGELTTPTGALVLTSLVGEFGPPPSIRVVSRGFGIGTKPLWGHANALTVALGECL
jgi:pyridinium-3,5-bisthiocarboxylic acid mononucleotide nickel chelatase